MESRKAPKYDLEKKRSMFFNVGLAISLATVLMAFEWKTEQKQIVILDTQEEEFDVIYDVKPTVIPPPPPPPIVPLKVIEVSNQQELVKHFEKLIEEPKVKVIAVPDVIFVPEVEEKIVDAPRDFVEQMPEPYGGMDDFMKFLSKNIKYPSQAKMMDVGGKVFVQFVIDKQGNITQIKTIKGIGAGCDKEAERVLSLASKWKPGRQGNQRVSVRMIIPIIFKLH